MIKSMYSGISGMNAQQKKLDVIGDNIANASTTAFKSSRVTFQDTIKQADGKASGPNASLGGTNPKLIGMGVNIQSIDVNTRQGNLQPTGRPLDLAIDGSGYFMVAKGSKEGVIKISDQDESKGRIDSESSKDLQVFFTRDGELKLDSLGNLVTPDGLRVLGYDIEGVDVKRDGDKIAMEITDDQKDEKYKANAGEGLKPLAIPEKMGAEPDTKRVQNFTIEKDGLIKVMLDDGNTVAIGQIAMASFVNPSALEGIGKNKVVPTANSGQALVRPGIDRETPANEKGSEAYGDMIQSVLEMSNVDLAVEFTEMIVASRSFQACSKVITTGDEILQELVNLKR